MSKRIPAPLNVFLAITVIRALIAHPIPHAILNALPVKPPTPAIIPSKRIVASTDERLKRYPSSHTGTAEATINNSDRNNAMDHSVPPVVG